MAASRHFSAATGWSQASKGLNDLIFQSNGDLYFTDQGDTGMHDPRPRSSVCARTGGWTAFSRMFPVRTASRSILQEDQLFVAVTFAQQVWRCPLLPGWNDAQGRRVSKVSPAAIVVPMGSRMDERAALQCVIIEWASVWMFDALGVPTFRVVSCKGMMTTNLAYGGADQKNFLLQKSKSGCILVTRVPTLGDIR